MDHHFINSQVLGAENETHPLESKGVVLVFPQMLLITILLLFSVLHLSMWIVDLSLVYVQVVLVLGPLLRFSYTNHRNDAPVIKVVWWQALPYFILAVVSFVGWHLDFFYDFDHFSHRSLSISCYVLAFSLIMAYTIWVLFRAQSIDFSSRSSEVNVILIVTMVFVVLTPIVFLKLSEVFFVGLNDSYSIGNTIYIVVILVALKLLWVLFDFLRVSVPQNKEQTMPYSLSVHKTPVDLTISAPTPDNENPQPETVQLAAEVEAALMNSKWIVNPTISLDSMEAKTGIAKSRLSHLFNTYYKKGFYQMIGEYRIRYAMTILDENKNISFEALSDMCGFNSKTTFYKYFKAVNECTPNQYLRSLNKEENSSENNVR